MRRWEGVGRKKLTLNVGAWSFASRRAFGARGELGLDVLFDVSDASAGEEEDTEEDKGQIPRVDGVSDACQSCGDESTGRKRVLGVGAIDHQPQGWRCDGGLHVGRIAALRGW